MASINTNQIRTAVAQLGAQEPAWAERYQTGARLLINGGWNRHAQFVTFPGGVVCQLGGCSCQEGMGPIICVHRVALAVLDHAETHCVDCGAVLADHTVARIGHQLLTTCRRCHAARAAAGRQRQRAADLRTIERAAAVLPC
jgi:hypothetical protein